MLEVKHLFSELILYQNKGHGVSLNELLKRGAWKSKHKFRTYYSRDIQGRSNRFLSSIMLQQFSQNRE